MMTIIRLRKDEHNKGEIGGFKAREIIIIILYINWARKSVRKSHTLIANEIIRVTPYDSCRRIHTLKNDKFEAWRGLKFLYFIPIRNEAFFATAVHHFANVLASLCSSGTPALWAFKLIYIVDGLRN